MPMASRCRWPMKLELDQNEVETLRALVAYGLIAKKGHYLHGPHAAKMKHMMSIASKIGMDPDKYYPSDDR